MKNYNLHYEIRRPDGVFCYCGRQIVDEYDWQNHIYITSLVSKNNAR